MTRGHEPAFARPFSKDDYTGDYPEAVRQQTGLTKREYFAASALQGILSGAEKPASLNEAVDYAVLAADRLTARLNGGES